MVGGRPNSLAGAGGRVWAGAFRSERLDRVDPVVRRRVVRRLRPEIGVGLRGLRSAAACCGRSTRARPAGRCTSTPAPAGRQARRSSCPASRPRWRATARRRLGRRHGCRTTAAATTCCDSTSATGALEETLPVRDFVTSMLVARGALWMLRRSPTTLVRHRPRRPASAAASSSAARSRRDLAVRARRDLGDALRRRPARAGRPADVQHGHRRRRPRAGGDRGPRARDLGREPGRRARSRASTPAAAACGPRSSRSRSTRRRSRSPADGVWTGSLATGRVVEVAASTGRGG